MRRELTPKPGQGWVRNIFWRRARASALSKGAVARSRPLGLSSRSTIKATTLCASVGTIVRWLVKATDDENRAPDPALVAEELNAVEVPDAEVGRGAAAPMVGSFVATGVIQLVQAVIGVVLARILGPADRGELAAVILWPTLLTTIGSFGLAQAATYHAARAPRLGVLVGSTLAVAVADSILLVAIGWAILPLVLGGHEDSVVRDAQLFLSAFVPLSLIAVSMMSILNGSHRFAWFQSLRLILIGTTVTGIVVLAATGSMTVGSAAAAYIAGYVVTATVALAVVMWTVGSEIGVSRDSARGLLGFGWRSQLSTSMWSLNERADQLVISAFFSPASLGLYVVAVTLTSLTTLVGFSFALVALPMIARFEALRERQRMARLIVASTLLCATAVSVPIFLAEPTLIRLLFGADFADAAGVGRVLLVAGIVFALNRVLEAVLQAVGRPLESSIGEGVALAMTAAGLAVLLPTMGIMGAGVTSLIAYAASSTFMVFRAAQALEMPRLRLLAPERGMFAKIRSLTRLIPGFSAR
jgi:O-antigen/teichoic acid export membrane protein